MFDTRHIKWWWQRRTRGWDNRDLWSLDITVFEFLLPRLKKFAVSSKGYPMDTTSEGWDEELAKMIRSIELWLDGDGWVGPENREEFEVGWRLLTERFFHMWL